MVKLGVLLVMSLNKNAVWIFYIESYSCFWWSKSYRSSPTFPKKWRKLQRICLYSDF